MMQQNQRIAIIGECMVELKEVKGVVEQGFGGDTLNTAVYLSRQTREQGVEIAFLTGMGRDPFSQRMLAAWQQEGLETGDIHISSNKVPGIYAIETAACGERSFYYWRNDSAAKYWLQEIGQEAATKLLSQFGMIYLSGISLAILTPESREILFAALTECKQQGVRIAFDNNYRPALWTSVDEAQQAYQTMLALTDLAFLTFDDEIALWGDSNEAEAIARSQAFGVTEIVIKRGADACFVILDGAKVEVPATLVSNVIDTTAAGDSFSAGYLAKRVLGHDVTTSALQGHRLAGTVIQHRGAIIAAEHMPD